MKKTFKQSSFILLITIGLMIFTFSGCNNDVLNRNSSLENIESELTSQQDSSNKDDSNKEERINKFLAMANHDNYIIGYISESNINTTNGVRSYVIVETLNGEKYRIEGFDTENSYLAGNFFLTDSCSIYPGSIDGKNVVFFYDEAEELIDGTYYIEKAKEFLIVEPDNEMVEAAKLLQKRADIFIKNFNAIENPQILSPEEAMLAVIDEYNLENMQRDLDAQGRLIYESKEGYRLVLERMLFNESLGMSAQEIEEHSELVKKFGISRPQWGAYPETDDKDEYIIYVIAFEKRLPDDWYVDVYNVHVSGEITKR